MKTQLGTSYFANRHLAHAAQDLKDIRKRHCSWVLHTFDEADLRFNRGQIKAITKISKQEGLSVYYSPWGLGGVFGGESISAFAGRHPEACQVLNTGRRVPQACLAHPAFRAFVKTWIQAAIAAGGDVLFWDEPHLWLASWEGEKDRESVYSVGSPYAQALFKKRHGKGIPKKRTAEVEAFRHWMVLDFIRWATRTAKGLSKRIKNAVCLLPHLGSWPHPLWEGVAGLQSVDIVATDPYWKFAPWKNPKIRPLQGYVDLMARRLAEIGRRHGKETQFWVQIFGLRKKDEPMISQALAMAEAAGIRNFGAWGYEGCAAYESLASQRPKACWERLGRDYARLSRLR